MTLGFITGEKKTVDNNPSLATLAASLMDAVGREVHYFDTWRSRCQASSASLQWKDNDVFSLKDQSLLGVTIFCSGQFYKPVAHFHKR